jgi:hypothetical protein
VHDGDILWDERSARERLTHILPGFRGYELPEHRRETDGLFRSFGAHRLGQVRARVEEMKRALRGRARSPYSGIARRLARICDALETRPPQWFVDRRAPAHDDGLAALYAQEEDVVRGVVALAVAVHERAMLIDDLTREIERVERGIERRAELLAELLT